MTLEVCGDSTVYYFFDVSCKHVGQQLQEWHCELLILGKSFVADGVDHDDGLI